MTGGRRCEGTRGGGGDSLGLKMLIRRERAGSLMSYAWVNGVLLPITWYEPRD